MLASSQKTQEMPSLRADALSLPEDQGDPGADADADPTRPNVPVPG
jgi:hypothetical protein